MVPSQKEMYARRPFLGRLSLWQSDHFSNQRLVHRPPMSKLRRIAFPCALCLFCLCMKEKRARVCVDDDGRDKSGLNIFLCRTSRESLHTSFMLVSADGCLYICRYMCVAARAQKSNQQNEPFYYIYIRHFECVLLMRKICVLLYFFFAVAHNT